MTTAHFELSQRFFFEAAHTLRRAEATGEVESSRRVHGHSYSAEITLRGQPDERGMVMDLGLVRAEIALLRDRLDHRFLDEVSGLGPATLENLCRYIAAQLQPRRHRTIGRVRRHGLERGETPPQDHGLGDGGPALPG